MIRVATLDRYLLRRLTRGYVVTVGSFAAFLWLLAMLDLLEDARGAAGLATAVWQAARVIPENLVDLLPMVTVLATAAVAGALNRDREITVMRASGVSLPRITRVALVPGLALAVLAIGFLQWAAPALYQGPARIAGTALGESGLWHAQHGLWLRRGGEYLNVGELELGRTPVDVSIYHFDDDGRLRREVRAARAFIETPDRWRLVDVRIREFDAPGERRIEHRDEYEWQAFVGGEQLEVLLRPPASLPLTELWLYVGTLRAQGQDTGEYALILWRRLALPLACLGMILVGMAAATASLRSSAASARVAGALAIGLGYQLGVEMVARAGLVAGVPGPLLAVAPPVMLVAFGAWLLARAR